VFLFLPKRAATGLSRAAIGASSDIIASIDIKLGGEGGVSFPPESGPQLPLSWTAISASSDIIASIDISDIK